ncbi:unnamed protein product [Prorocentrum cordatum]|uniref:SRCR domain-containing protein n=1 Tax=Prorocentrum cordatum TaxID=2364126 RepID=A0ABN9V192_9DINO|nr:unnamed protein product [Polarella glacialis]
MTDMDKGLDELSKFPTFCGYVHEPSAMEPGMPRGCSPEPSYRNRGEARLPTLTMNWAAGFSFHRCHAERTVPADYHLKWMFSGEEANRAARLWTHGYDLYVPVMPVVLHDYTSAKQLFWQYRDEKAIKRSQRRLRKLLSMGGDTAGAEEPVAPYALGSQRTMEQFVNWSRQDLGETWGPWLAEHGLEPQHCSWGFCRNLTRLAVADEVALVASVGAAPPERGTVRLSAFPSGRLEVYDGTRPQGAAGADSQRARPGSCRERPTAVCQQLGYDAGVSSAGSRHAIRRPPVVGNRACNGSEATFFDCPLRDGVRSEFEGCRDGHDAWLTCRNASALSHRDDGRGCCQVSQRDNKCAVFEYPGERCCNAGEPECSRPRCEQGHWAEDAVYDKQSGLPGRRRGRAAGRTAPVISALSALVPELGRSLGTGIAVWAARGDPAVCPACTCEPTLQRPDLHCDCSGPRGDAQAGPSTAGLVSYVVGVTLAGASAGAAGGWVVFRLRGHHAGSSAVQLEPDELGEEARAQVRALRERTSALQALIHERIVVALNPTTPDTASIITVDGDTYEEQFRSTADVRHWDVLPGGSPGGVFPWAPAAWYYRFRAIPTAAALTAAAGRACARQGVAAPAGPVVPYVAGRVAAAAAPAATAAAVPAALPGVALGPEAGGLGALVAALGGQAGGAAGGALAPAPAPAAAAAASAPAAPGAEGALVAPASPAALAEAPAVPGAAAVPAAGPLAERPAPAGLRAGPPPASPGGDAHIFAIVRDVRGVLHADFRSMVALMVGLPWPDWPVCGPRTLLRVMQYMAQRSGTPTAHHQRWLAEIGLGPESPGVEIHQMGCMVVEPAVAYDPVRAANLGHLELAARSVQVQEALQRVMAAAKGPTPPGPMPDLPRGGWPGQPPPLPHSAIAGPVASAARSPGDAGHRLGEDRNRDLLPLPLLAAAYVAPGSWGTRRRVRACHAFSRALGRADAAVHALNYLYGDQSSPAPTPSAGQRCDAARIWDSIVALGPEPDAYRDDVSDPNGAFRELLAGPALHPDGGGPTTPYVPDLVSWPDVSQPPAPLLGLLGGRDSAALREWRCQMLRGPEEARQLRAEACPQGPCADPALLRSPLDYAAFLRPVVERSMLTFSPSRGRLGNVGIFFVPKKSGQLRIIFDARAFIDARRTQLPSASAWGRLEAGDVRFSIASADLDMAFYHMRVPDGMEEYFTLPPIPAKYLAPHGITVAGVDGESLLLPQVVVLPMGFSWALHLCQAVLQTSLGRAGFSPSDLILDGQCGCQLTDDPDSVVGAGYVDNYFVLGGPPKTVSERLQAVADDLMRHGLAVHELEAPSQDRDFLGLSLREGRWLSLGARNIWRLRAAIRASLRRQVISGLLLRVLTGHITWALLPRRELLCILGATYAYIEAAGPTAAPLWPTVRHELQLIHDLLPPCKADLGAAWHWRVACADASPFGLGVVARRAPQDLVGAIGRVAEKWRYKVEGGAQARSRTVGLNLDISSVPLGDSGASSLISGMTLVYLVMGPPGDADKSILDMRPAVDFDEVPAHFVRGSAWGSVAAVCVDGRANIWALEGGTLVLGYRHLLRSTSAFGSRFLILSDSLPLVLSVGKGRARSRHLQSTLRKAGCWRMRLLVSLLALSQIAAGARRLVAPVPSALRTERARHARELAAETAAVAGLSLLERLAVRSSTARPYRGALASFVAYCAGRRLDWTSHASLGQALVEFMDNGFLRGGGGNQGNVLVAAAAPFLGSFHMRTPVLLARAAWLAFCVLVMFASCLRPWGAAKLYGRHLVAPSEAAGPGYQFFGLLLHESGQEPGRTGALKLSTAPSEPLWGQEVSRLGALFSRARRRLSLDRLRPHLCSLRRGGASNDMLSQRRQMAEAQRRGRWRTTKSLNRYTGGIPPEVMELRAFGGPPADAVRRHLQWQFWRAAAPGRPLRRRLVLELFCGAGANAKAVLACGLAAFGPDWQRSPLENHVLPAFVATVVGWIRSRLTAIRLGYPAS